MAVVMAACVDDSFLEDRSLMPGGEATVNIEAAFEPFTESGIQSRAGYADAPHGNLMNDVSDVVLLAYDVKGDLLDGFPMELTFDEDEIKDEERTGDDATSGKTDETTTKCLTKKNVKLRYGEYYLVAVANMGQYTMDEDGTITTTQKTIDVLNGMERDEYNTLHKLRSLRRHWDNSLLENNREMCGYFVVKDDEAKGAASNYCSDFLTVKVDREGMTLRAWLRRAASKVTVDFDGSGLRENVKIYIKDVKIYDLAESCTLGFGKTPKADSNEEINYIDYNNAIDDADGMIHEGGHVINFYNMYDKGAGDADEQHSAWPMIAKGSPYIYDDPEANVKVRKDLHANGAQSLFFYENMQGPAPHGKGPVADLINGGVANSETKKENVEFGTYIEVTGYYESEAAGNLSNGPITYRFLLGKDAIENCDAERNYHYKVTLKFNGNANDYSWHIDYKEEPDTWEVPTPWYVSYLYGHTASIPFKYTPPEGYEVVYFDAKIETNNWNPELSGDDEATIRKYDSEILDTFNDPENKAPAHGFLSLRYIKEVNITPDMCKYTTADGGLPNYGGTTLKTLNERYFKGGGTNGLDQSKRRFVVVSDGTVGKDEQDNDTERPQEIYSYRRDVVSQSVELDMPVFTRPKSLLRQSGYTGNNPFVGFLRKAFVTVTPYVREIGTTEPLIAMTSKDIEVTQVRRIVNPKGVYRRARNNQDFEVHLLHLPSEFHETFVDFTSNGPWMAEVLGDQNFITLDGKDQIYGSTGSSIKFTIRFNKLNLDDKVRNAIVRVKYHSYTCTHLIYVRQGYEPQAICETAYDFDHQYNPDNEGNGVAPVEWLTFNRRSKNENTDDPRDEGSLFKFGNTTPIDAFNNCYGDYERDGKYDGIGNYGVPGREKFYDGDAASNGSYYLTNDNGTRATDVTAWGDISWNGNGFVGTNAFPEVAGEGRMPTLRQLEQLYATPDVQFGFGVLYADGATTTQTAVNDAYGYYRDDPDKGKKGMRGVFVYNWDEKNLKDSYTGRNVFFPIGRSGYGHRKEGYRGWGTWDERWEYYLGRGILRYTCNGYASRGKGERTPFDKSAPFFSQLYFRQGGIYYAKEKTADGKYYDTGGAPENSPGIGLDINYFSLDFNGINGANLSDGADACMVRFIK